MTATEEMSPAGRAVTRSGTRLCLLGGFRLDHDGAAQLVPASGQRVVAYVALNTAPVGRGRVAADLWPDSCEERANANLRSALWRMSRCQPGLVEVADGALALAEQVEIDVHEMLDNARRLLHLDSSGPATDIDERQFTDELLPDWWEDWVLMERERLRQLSLHAVEALAHELCKAQQYGRAIEAALASVRGEPLRESAHRTLIEIHLAEGNRSEAIRQYQRYRDLLAHELDLEPTAGLTALVHGDVAVTGR